MYFRALFASLAILLLPSLALAQTAEEISKRYNGGKPGQLQGEALRIFRLHQADPVLAKYDVKNLGYLDDQEFKHMMADLRTKYAQQRGKLISGPATPAQIKQLTYVGQGEWEASHEGIPIESLAQPAPVQVNGCKPQSLYIRHDRLDTFLYGITPTSKAQGASFGFTDDFEKKTRSGTVDAFVGYALWENPCVPRPPGASSYVSGHVFAPWVDAHGTLSSTLPRSIKTEHSVIKAGADAQIEVTGGPIFNLQYLTASPYVQSDFRDTASGQGVSFSWQPYQLDWRLGGNHSRFSDFVDWYWQLNAEADLKEVQRPGLTNLPKGQFAWTGGIAKLHVDFFVGEQFPPEIRDRVHFIGTLQEFYDLVGKTKAENYQAVLAYDLSADGSTSVSAEYDHGRDKDTFVYVNQLLLKLSYKN